MGARRDEQRDTTSEVVSVTTAPVSREVDQSARIRRYLLTMAIRTLCFVLLVVIDSWVRWLFLAGAVFLPYLAVVLANARAPQVPGQMGLPAPRADDIRHLRN